MAVIETRLRCIVGNLVVVCLLVIASSSQLNAQDSLGAKLAALESTYRSAIVQVKYRQQVITSTAEPAQEEELVTTGLVVSEDGLVMVSTMIYEPFTQVPHGVGIRFPASVSRLDAKVSEARILTASGDEFPAELVGRDPEADVAFMKFDPGTSTTSVVRFGSRDVSVGEQVAVISWLPQPLGPGISVELSRVQALTTRPNDGFMISTSVADPVGSLVSSVDGEPVGLLDALVVAVPNTQPRNPLGFLSVFRDLPKGVGRGFARSASKLEGAAVTVTDASSPRRGWLGVEMQALTPKLARHMELPVEQGIVVGYVYRDSAAEQAGLEVGDVLTAVGGESVGVSHEEDLGAFGDRIVRAGPGAILALSFYRDGVAHKADAVLKPAPASAREAETAEVEELDLTVRELTYDYRATRFLASEKKGVVVVKPPVGVSSSPNRVGPGDLLVRLGDEPVDDVASFRQVSSRLRQSKPQEVILFIERGKESFFFALKPDWDR